VKLRRLVGFLFIAAAAAGVIFSVAGLFGIWRYRPLVTRYVTDTLALYDQTLVATQDGLASIGLVVENTTLDVTSLQATTLALAQTVHDTSPMIDSLTGLTGKDLPDAIHAAQTSLTSAQGSALLIDNALATITSIPFLPVPVYKPEVPLHTALAQVSSSLDSIKPALVTLSSSLEVGKTNLGAVEVELNKISETTKVIGTALSGAQTVIDQYKTTTTQLKLRVESTQLAVPGWITTIAWILTFGLVWFLIAQVGLCLQGLDILREHNVVKS
jgi:hypothetical protein